MDHTLCLAPMIDWTDRHFRFFLRLITPHVVLYTEMITTGALIHGDQDRHLRFNKEEHPVALQLGGSSPEALAECALLAKTYGYDEINFNVGCPSDRVQKGRFGACLMNEPALVAECVSAMRQAANVPVTVKTRIGVDENDSYDALIDFVEAVQQTGCDTVIIHARKAWLKGLSPKENRTIPPLKYEVVYQLKQDFPALTVVINGGIQSVDAVQCHLNNVDGVMLGREAYQNPYIFAELEQALFGQPLVDRKVVINSYAEYVRQCLNEGVRLQTLIRPIMCLFNGLPGAKQWRRHLSEYAHLPGATEDVILNAMTFI